MVEDPAIARDEGHVQLARRSNEQPISRVAVKRIWQERRPNRCLGAQRHQPDTYAVEKTPEPGERLEIEREATPLTSNPSSHADTGDTNTPPEASACRIA